MNEPYYPPDISLEFVMSDKNLWVTWMLPTRELKILGRKGMFNRWLLADSFEEMKEFSNIPIVAGINVHDLNLLYNTVKERQISWWPFGNSLYFVQKNDGYLGWEMDKNKITKNDSILFSGNLNSIKKLVDEGNRILTEKDYISILGDTRKRKKGLPEDWMGFMINPSNALHYRQIIKKYFPEGL